MDSFRAIAIVAVALSLLGFAATEDTASCGSAEYFPSEYNCYNNSALCPVTFSLPTKPCSGSGGCYSPYSHSCDAGTLKSLPKATSAFTLTAHGTRPTYRNMSVKACGGFLAVGANARECTSCRDAPAGVNCKSYGGRTVFLPDGKMVRHRGWFVGR